MRCGVVVLAAQPVGDGFALAGFPVTDVAGDEQAAEAMQRIERDPDTGVVLIEQQRFDALPERQRQRLARQPVPVPVPFPGPSWEETPASAEAYVVELLRQVIGYRVRLR